MNGNALWSQVVPAVVTAGITAHTVHGAQMTAALYELQPHAEVPEHRHINEEFGQVIAGALELRTGGKTTQLTVGDAFLIPGNQLHAAQAGADGCTLLECYAPSREVIDWKKQGGNDAG